MGILGKLSKCHSVRSPLLLRLLFQTARRPPNGNPLNSSLIHRLPWKSSAQARSRCRSRRASQVARRSGYTNVAVISSASYNDAYART